FKTPVGVGGKPALIFPRLLRAKPVQHQKRVEAFGVATAKDPQQAHPVTIGRRLAGEQFGYFAGGHGGVLDGGDGYQYGLGGGKFEMGDGRRETGDGSQAPALFPLPFPVPWGHSCYMEGQRSIKCLAMDVTPIIDTLNSAQRDAVTHTSNHLLVLAGAGSGKTRVLVHRIGWLVRVEHVAPHAMLAVTFTNKAAREMRERVQEMLGSSPRGMWVGTFHGLAHRLLKAHWHEAKLPENFQILDADDQLRLLKRIYRNLG